jgi:hypothetical protein
MASINRKGYGQVEPNHLSAQYTGQIYAQLPAMGGNDHATPIAQLENGQFLKYNYKDNVASVDGDGEWMLVFNEVKLYDERRRNYKDFAMLAKEQSDGKIFPRLLKTNIGDIFTTNTFGSNAAGPDADVVGANLEVGNQVTPNAQGFLAAAGENPTGPVFQVVKVYTLADKQPAVKLQRIK